MESLRCFGVFNSPSSTPFLHRSQHNLSSINNLPSTAKRANCSCLPAFLAAAVLFSSPVPPEETLANIPQTLSGKKNTHKLLYMETPSISSLLFAAFHRTLGPRRGGREANTNSAAALQKGRVLYC
ncbi:hypothetical protein KFK09_013064 [Dendrobium nobile]|uniref:Uncharacterized protein n=1 Tax=Dendrobium nobile TaxID=94219 RepID=A0A8T3BL51_DENNO|nr:hypothetical protein KFK09_013064 [Dendrobium nobile]